MRKTPAPMMTAPANAARILCWETEVRLIDPFWTPHQRLAPPMIRPSRQAYTAHCSMPPRNDVTWDEPGSELLGEMLKLVPRSEAPNLVPSGWGITGPPGLRAGTVRSGHHPSSKRTSPRTSPWSKHTLNRDDAGSPNVTLRPMENDIAARVTSPSPQASA